MNKIIFNTSIKAKLINNIFDINILILQDIFVNENTLGNVYTIKALTNEIDLNRAKAILIMCMLFKFESKEIDIKNVIISSCKEHSENYISLELMSVKGKICK